MIPSLRDLIDKKDDYKIDPNDPLSGVDAFATMLESIVDYYDPPVEVIVRER